MGNAVSLAVDVQRVVLAALVGFTRPVLVGPLLYGQGGVEAFAYYVANHPQGWVVLHTPRMIGPRALDARWTVQLEAVAPTRETALSLARDLATRLHGTPRNPTAFVLEGDAPAGQPAGGNGHKITLTFVATIRHGE